MKTIQKVLQVVILAITLIILTGMATRAQEVIEVKNIKALMSKGTQTCYVVDIPHADLAVVQQNWIKKLQEGSKIKVKEVNHELVYESVVKTELTKDTVNIYSLLIQREEARVILNVFVEIKGIFFEPKEDKTNLVSDQIDNNIKNYVRSFAVEQYKAAVANDLEGEQKFLENQQNELKKLEKDEENMTKENSSLENDIDKTEREISEIERNITLKDQEIQTHNTSILTLTSDTDKKASQDKQKDLEKEKNQLEKSRSKAKDNISDDKSNIEKNNKAIEESKKLQEEKKEEITKQTEVVTQVQTELDGIK
jgi:hypothetical protein